VRACLPVCEVTFLLWSACLRLCLSACVSVCVRLCFSLLSVRIRVSVYDVRLCFRCGLCVCLCEVIFVGVCVRACVCLCKVVFSLWSVCL